MCEEKGIMEETKKRTRKTAAVKEEKMAKKAPAAVKTAAEKKNVCWIYLGDPGRR